MLRVIVAAAVIVVGLSVTPAGADHDPPDLTVGVRQDPYGVHECSGRDHVVYWGLIGGESWRDLRDSGYPEPETMAMLDARYPILPGMWTFDLDDAYVWLDRAALDFTVLDAIYVSNDGLPVLERTQQPSRQTARGDCYHFTNDPAYYHSGPEPVPTTTVPATTTTIPLAPSTTQPPPTTTESLPAPSNPPSTAAPALAAVQPSTVDGYDLFDAEWDGYPFEETILLLEERYPPGTPDRFHFRLSAAVEFLRQGGMVRGLDNLWESGS